MSCFRGPCALLSTCVVFCIVALHADRVFIDCVHSCCHVLCVLVICFVGHVLVFLFCEHMAFVLVFVNLSIFKFLNEGEFFCTLRFSDKCCPIINHTSMERSFIQLSDDTYISMSQN